MRQLRKGKVIRFNAISDFTGETLTLTGTIVGHASDVRRRWPEEAAEAEDCYLVRREDNFGNVHHYIVQEEDVI